MKPEFDGAQWPDVESELQRRWEESQPHSDLAFEDGELAVRLGFMRPRRRSPNRFGTPILKMRSNGLVGGAADGEPPRSHPVGQRPV